MFMQLPVEDVHNVVPTMQAGMPTDTILAIDGIPSDDSGTKLHY